MSDMTIAQALRRVNKLKGLIKEHKEAANGCASYVEDKKPEFDFNEEVVAMHALIGEMVDLKSRIAAANANHTIVDGNEQVRLSVAVLTLTELKGQISFYKELFLKSGLERDKDQEWDDNADKYVTKVTEKTWVSAMTEKEKLAKVRELEDKFESLNNAVEDANHKILV